MGARIYLSRSFNVQPGVLRDQRGFYMPLRRPLDSSRNLFPKMYPAMVDTVQMIGSSSLMATPCEADLTNEIGDDVAKYFQTVNLQSKDRIALFRLAHDVAVSGFGNRQALYERFFFGSPQILAAGYFDLYNKEDMIERVDNWLSSN